MVSRWRVIGQVPEDPVGLVTVPRSSEPGTRSLIHVGPADAAIGGTAQLRFTKLDDERGRCAVWCRLAQGVVEAMASRVSVRQAFAIGSSSYRTLLHGTVPRERASDMTCPMATAKGFQELGFKALRGRGAVRQRRGEASQGCGAKDHQGRQQKGKAKRPAR